MTTDNLHGEDADLEERAAREQKLASEIAVRTTRTLQAMGYDLIVVRIAKVVRGKDGECAMPGATVAATAPIVAPCLRMEADELRSIAKAFDAEFDRVKPSTEAMRGYVEQADPEEYGL